MAKRTKTGKLCPWLSARADDTEKRFIQVGDSLLFDAAFQGMSTGARYLYLCFAMAAAGHRTFTFTGGKAKQYGYSSTSFWRYVAELQKAGFIAKQSGQNVRAANIYTFAFDWKKS